MDRRFLFASVCLLFLSSLVGTAHADELRLQPTVPWHLDYSDDSCRVVRQFGEGDDTVALMMDRYQPGAGFRVIIAGKPTRQANSGRDGELRFGDHEAPQEIDFERGIVGDLPALIFTEPVRLAPLSDAEKQILEDRADNVPDGDWVNFESDPISEERYRHAEFLVIDAPRMDTVILETGRLDQIFSAFDRCIEELLTHWGIDADAHRSLSQPVIPASNPGRWVVTSDYPREELNEGGQGLVYFRLSVDEQGQPTECHIQRSTRSDHFQDAVCEALMRRAEFRPALDADGLPIASYFISTVYFTMGRR